ncbi:MAG: hypothetical protein RLZZ165_1820 [Bacteroidota bacterium]|jgi:hypothetical protein
MMMEFYGIGTKLPIYLIDNMKKVALCLLLAAASAACKPRTATTDAAVTTAVHADPSGGGVDSNINVLETDDKNTMDHPHSANQTTGPQANAKTQQGKTFVVSGNVLLQRGYCGGAPPTPEVEEEARRPKPYANQVFIVRGGDENDVDKPIVERIRTDGNGDFRVELTPGTYCMVLEEKEKARDPNALRRNYQVVNEECDQKWLRVCELSFTVAGQDISGLRLTLNQKCNVISLSPCITYDGPLPPAAPPRH